MTFISGPVSNPSDSGEQPSTARSPIEALGHFVRRIYEVLSQAKAALVVRVSTPKQFEESKGSLEFQQRQIRYLEPYDVNPSDVELYMSAESAQGEDDRPDFERLVQRIEAGMVRLVIAAFADRMSRNWPQFTRLGDALAKVKGIIILEGEPFDFASSRSRHDFWNAANLAVYQSEQRVQRNLVNLCAKAKKLALSVPVPVGTCWASLEDIAFMQAIEEQKMSDALGTAPHGHLTNVSTKGRRLLVLPYPDRSVYDSMILRRDVLLHTRDIRAVVDMIHTDSSWPRKHHWPVRRRGVRFSPSEPIEWRDLRTYRAQTHSDQQRNLIARWYQSPMLYGTYEWQLADDVELDDHLKAFGAKVSVANACPDSLFLPNQRDLVREILSKRDKRVWPVAIDLTAENARVPRPPSEWRRAGLEPLLPDVRCAVAWRGEEACHGKLVPTGRLRTPRIRYVSVQCRSRHGMLASLSREAEGLIAATVLSEVSPEIIRDAVARIDLKQSVEKSRLDVATRELEDLETSLAFLRKELAKPSTQKQKGLTNQVMKALGEAGDRRDQMERTRTVAKAGLELERQLTDQDRARIFGLAANLPQLWKESESVPSARAALMGALIKHVYVRPIGTRMHYVEVEFPSGVRIDRVVCVSPVSLTPAWRLWCLTRLRTQLEGNRFKSCTKADLAEAERAAIELNQLLRRRHQTRRWTGSDVRAAAILAFYEGDDAVTSEIEGESLEELSARTTLPIDEVRNHARVGHLGEPMFADGKLRYRPTEVQMCRWFPEYARQHIAMQMNWAIEDTITVEEAAARYGVRRAILVQPVRAHGLAVPDAHRRPWLSASALAATLPPTLAEAVDTLCLPGVSETDFLAAEDATATLERLTGRRVSKWWHINGKARGQVLVVRARRSGCVHEARRYVYLPNHARGVDRESRVHSRRAGRAGTARCVRAGEEAGQASGRAASRRFCARVWNGCTRDAH
jgi:DNA invertase Pin-like site-specific DNA recombinase